MKGEALLTGPEYIVAKSQGCKIDVEYMVEIPYECKWVTKGDTVEKILINLPYKDPIINLQQERAKYAKDTVENKMAKDKGNSLYGNTVKGISAKKYYDVKTKSMVAVTPNVLSNPILGCYITAFIRSLLGECLHNIYLLKGKVISCTTDGFITDIEFLEEKMLKLPAENTILLRMFRTLRTEISGNPNALEIKNNGVGVVS